MNTIKTTLFILAFLLFLLGAFLTFWSPDEPRPSRNWGGTLVALGLAAWVATWLIPG